MTGVNLRDPRALAGAALTVLAGACFGAASALATDASLPREAALDTALNTIAAGALLLATAWALLRPGRG